MFYGMPARIVNPDGKAIQGTLGFVGALLKMVRLVKPTHIAVLFDGEYASQRRELDEEYKANREDLSSLPEEETPFSQLPDIYAALDYLGICHGETRCCEADDWIAGYALSLGKEKQVTVVSQDGDFFQLISEGVSVLRYRGENSVLCTPDHIEKKLGITPEQYADFKSLTGDTADNIQGAPKVGPKTAAALLQQFGTLEAILENIPLVKKPSVRASLAASADRLRLNQRLIRLTGGEDLPFSLEEMAYTYQGQTTTQTLTALNLR
jgi:DNA polymerase-1